MARSRINLGSSNPLTAARARQGTVSLGQARKNQGIADAQQKAAFFGSPLGRREAGQDPNATASQGLLGSPQPRSTLSDADAQQRSDFFASELGQRELRQGGHPSATTPEQGLDTQLLRGGGVTQAVDPRQQLEDQLLGRRRFSIRRS